jgi:type I restriction enzyme, S subunit
MRTGWEMTPLGDVLTRSDEAANLEPDREYREITVKLWGKGVTQRGVVTGAGIAAQRRYVARRGQFILSRIDARNGALGIVPPELDGAVVTNDFPVFRVHEGRLLPEYLGWMCRTRGFVEECKRASEGTTNRVRLQEGRFLAREIRLPPLAEQQRVVARIEELVYQIQEARDLRQRAEFEARGVVSATRNQHVNCLRHKHADVQLADVCSKITDGPHVSPRYVDKGVPFISVRNISETGLDFGSAKYVTDPDHAEYSKKALVERGDVLYTKGGTTGVARRVDTDRPFRIWVHVALLKLRREQADAGFIEHMLNAPSSKEQAELFTRGSSNRDLGLSRMAKITFPLPPLEEQLRIAAYLDEVQTEVSALIQAQQEIAAELDALLPTILDRAFKGELV